MVTLYIDTKNQKVVTVALKKDGKVLESLSEENEYGSQALLPLITKLLDRKKISKLFPSEMTFEDLEGVEVETGPGSFTGLKVGVSAANALGFALGIPVNGKKIEDKLVY